MTANRMSSIVAVFLCAAPLSADVWDVQSASDNNFGTQNALIHGAVQVHDLGVLPGGLADQDLFQMPQKPRASYEVIVDGLTGDLNLGTDSVTRIDWKGYLVQSSTDVIAGPGMPTSARALRWVNYSSTAVAGYIRVSGAACGTNCGADDQYTIRVHETTIHVARYNNTGTQSTILITQNPSDYDADFIFQFWSADGTLLLNYGNVIARKNVYVFNTATMVTGSGHITIMNQGGYGAMNVKAVALEPSTGFSFDTPGVYIPD